MRSAVEGNATKFETSAKSKAFWDVTPCILVDIRWRFGETECLSIQSEGDILDSEDYYYYYYYFSFWIFQFSALAVKYSPILGCSNQQD